MILLSERRLTLPQAAHRIGVNPSTCWRWSLKGVRDIRLETFSIGAKRFTTVEAIERFVERTTAAANGAAPKARTNRQRQAAIRRAEAKLDALGI